MGGESLRKFLADPDRARQWGRIVERALDILGWSQLRLAQELGYGDNQAPVSRWIAGTEATPIAKLWALESFRYGLFVALAEAAQDERIKVQTIVTLERRVGA